MLTVLCWTDLLIVNGTISSVPLICLYATEKSTSSGPRRHLRPQRVNNYKYHI